MEIYEHLENVRQLKYFFDKKHQEHLKKKGVTFHRVMYEMWEITEEIENILSLMLEVEESIKNLSGNQHICVTNV